MGTFEVRETTPACYAQALGDLNPLWSGSIHEPVAEVNPPVTFAAILIEKELKEE